MAGSKNTFWNLVLEISGDDKDATSALRAVKNQIAQVQAAGQELSRDFQAFTRNAGRLVAGAIGSVTAATAALVAGTHSVAEAGNEAYRASQRIGISAESFQALHFALGQGFTEASELNTALEKYNLIINRAAAGNESMQRQLTAIGLSAEELVAMGPEQSFLHIADVLKSLPNDFERTEMAATLFGRAAGPTMAAALSQGSESIQDLMEAGKRYGNFVSDDMAAASNEYLTQMSNLKTAVSGLKTQFFQGSITPMTEAFTILSDAIASNVPSVQELGRRFGEFVADLVRRLPEIIEKVKEFGTWIWDTINKVKDFVGGWKNLAIIIGGLAIAPTFISGLKVIWSFGKYISVLFKALPVILSKIPMILGIIAKAALPIIGIIAGIAAVVYTVIRNFDNLKQYALDCIERIKSAFSGGTNEMAVNWERVGEVAKDVLGIIMGILEGGVLFAIKTVMNTITSAIQIVIGVFQTLWNVVKLIFWPIETIIKVIAALFQDGWSGAIEVVKNQFSKLGDIFAGIFGGIKTIISGIVDFFKNLFGDGIEFVTRIFAAFGKNIEGIGDWIKSAFQAVGDFFKNLWEGIKKIFSAAWEGIKNIFLKYHPVGLVITHWETIKEFFIQLWENIKNIFSNAWEGIKNVFGKAGEFFGGVWSGIKDTAGRAWDGIKDIAGNALEGIKNVAGNAVENMKERWAIFKDVTSNIFNSIKNIAGKAWDGIKEGANKLKNKTVESFNKVRERAGMAFNSALDIGDRALDRLSERFPELAEAGRVGLNAIRLAANGDFSGMKEIGQNVLENIKAGLNTFKDNAIGVWSNVRDIAGNAWDNIKNVASNTWENIKDGASRFKDVSINAFNNIKEGAGVVFNNVLDVGDRALDRLSERFPDLASAGRMGLNAIRQAANGDFSGMKEIGQSALDNIKNGFANFKDFTSEKLSGVGDVFTRIFDGIREAFQRVIDFVQNGVQQIKDFFGSIGSGIGNVASTVGSGISNAASAVGNFVGNVGNAVGNFFTGGRNSIPGHADGGIFRTRHIAEIAEKGAEAVVPLNNSREGFDIWRQAGELGGYFQNGNNQTQTPTQQVSPVMQAAAQRLSGGDNIINFDFKMTNNFNGGTPDAGTVNQIEAAGHKVGDSLKERVKSILEELGRDSRRVSYA